MNLTITDHGLWETYVPSEIPEELQNLPMGVRAQFARRVGDGVDWYAFRQTLAIDTVKACVLPYPGEDYEVIKPVTWDAAMLFPASQRLIEISGFDPEDKKPWNSLAERIYDPATRTIGGPPPVRILSVSASQARVALFNAGLDDQVDAIVANHPYKPVRIFYASANNWLKSDPYVQAIAHELGLLTVDATGNAVDSGFDALFEAAAKI